MTLIIKMAKALDDQYTSEGLRLASFLDKWLKDEIVSPVDLVRVGLFYCRPGDRVKYVPSVVELCIIGLQEIFL